ncbi:MAG: V0D/AC39 family V-type ATPase subunit [Lachnospiraceae bacterium]
MANYTYAVARIRAKELSLFSQATLEQLVACKDEKACLQFLVEKGWGEVDTELDAETILAAEQRKTWKVIEEMVEDMSIFDVLSYPKLYHNLKAAIKQAVVGEVNANIFYNDCSIDGKQMSKIVYERNFGVLPEHMKEAAKEAYEAFLQTKDGQLCDVIVDRACLEAVYAAGQKSKIGILRDYAESTVAVADIKIAVRCQKTAKSMDFMRRALAPCSSVSTEQLAHAALSGVEAICSYLEGTSYRDGAEALAQSPSAFERWCDNQMIETIRSQKYNSFTAGPLAAYLLARENEIKTVRIILTGKQNNLSDEFIRERMREMYV